MRTTSATRSLIPLACAVLFAGGLGGCGGGGGSGPPVPTAPTLAITTGNRDLVIHDAAAGVMSLSATASIPLAGAASVSSGTSAQPAAMASTWSGWLAGTAIEHVRGAMPAAGRQQALAVTPPMVESCLVSGTTTTTVDDRDNSGTLSPGDVGTVVFNDCRDTAAETVNGTVSLAFASVDTNAFAAHATVTNISTVTTGQTLTISGSMLMEISAPDTVHTTIRTTAETPVQATINTHVPFSDTVVLQEGFVIEEAIDLSVASPTGTGISGRTLTTLSGQMYSTNANGTFDVAVANADAITRYYAEDYPRAGVLRVTGASGVLVLRTNSASSVVLDLDWNNDGVAETSEAKTWDWLI